MFHSARIKLTAWYLLIIMFVSVTFSIAIHRVLSNEIDRFSRMQRLRIVRRFQANNILPPDTDDSPIIDPALIQETEKRLDIIIVLINVGILVVSGGTGYFLAGKTLQPIQEMVDEQNRFITDASHELRTPLTALKTSMEVYMRGKKNTSVDTKKLISESIEDVNYLQSLSEKLLQLAQYEKPNTNTMIEQISVATILKESAAKVERLAHKKHISIKQTVANETVYGDKFAFVDLFVILLDNAIKYSPPKKNIFMNVKRIDGFSHIYVKDEGVGIPTTDIPHLFERFYRADKSRSKKVNGFGLGLAIAKKIVESNGGKIIVTSSVGKGSEFEVILPTHASRIPTFS